MPSICMYFQVHQPYWLAEYSFFDIGKNQGYFDERFAKENISRVAEACYLPANHTLKKLINTFPDTFHVSLSLSGVLLEQLQNYRPDVLESFQELVKTGNVEILGTPYNHSLSAVKDPETFTAEIREQETILKTLFDTKPRIFANTDLIFSQEIAETIEELDYKGVLTDAGEDMLLKKSPSQVYYLNNTNVKCLVRNSHLCENMLYGFSSQDRTQYPLSAKKFATWLLKHKQDKLINLFFNYENFGHKVNSDTGITDFLYQFPYEILQYKDFTFETPATLLKMHDATEAFDAYKTLSWWGEEKNLLPWLNNPMQEEAINKIYALKDHIRQSEDEQLKKHWNLLKISDHFVYMGTYPVNDEQTHRHSDAYNSPYDLYIYFMNIYTDLEKRCKSNSTK